MGVISMVLEVKKAVGTSLFIITLNTAIGFMGDYTSGVCYNWVFLLKLISVTVPGMICSSQLIGKISNEALKKVFGYTILVLGCWIIVKELVLNS